MQVAITGANGQVGRKLLEKLPVDEFTTTALIRHPTELPASHSVTDWMNNPKAITALRQAEAVVHLAGTLAPSDGNYRNANLLPTQRVADALKGKAGATVIFLSYLGASSESTNAYLRAKGRSEHLLTEATQPVIFKCSHIIGSPQEPGVTAANMIADDGGVVNLLGSGKQQVQPVLIDDVAQAINRALCSPRPGVYELAGPRTMTMDELAQLLNPGCDIRLRHMPQWLAKLAALVVPDLTRPLVEVMCTDSCGDASVACDIFGIRMTDLKEIWTKTSG